MPTCMNCGDYYDAQRLHYVCNKEALAAEVTEITDFLKTKGLTRFDISVKINGAERSIARWRKGEIRPNFEHMRKLRELHKEYQ